MKYLPLLLLLLAAPVQSKEVSSPDTCLEMVRGFWMLYTATGLKPDGYYDRIETCGNDADNKLSDLIDADEHIVAMYNQAVEQGLVY